jgi:exodeoxyribonuclease VII large subunit
VRVALQGRQIAELTHELRRSTGALIARRVRDHQVLRNRLDAGDVRRNLTGIRGRLITADARLRAATRRRHDRAHSVLAAIAGRLETLSPLAVLARGYAVCWNADRTAILRRATDVSAGDRVRVTLHEGELDCEVRSNGSDH